MKHESHDASCAICRSNAAGGPLFENDLWFVTALSAGVPGWMMMQAQRHVGGPA